MTSEQVMENIVSHGACAEGIAWATGKDSEAMWASTDKPQYLLWWAIQNTGQPGWATPQQIMQVFEKIVSIACVHAKDTTTAWLDELRAFGVEDKFAEKMLRFYRQVEEKVEDVNAFRAEILPIVKELNHE